MKQPENSLRLGQKFARDRARDVDIDRVIGEQSLRGAVLGSLLAWLLLNSVWVYGCLLFDRFFPWFSIIQGFFIGRAVQHYGRGIDWRFPVLAAAVAILAAFVGSFVSALFLTGREFDTSVLSLVGEISWHTISTFASREFATVGTIYACMAAALAGFFANRRLDRYEAVALRKHREAKGDE